MNLADELQKLAALKEQGALTDDEFVRAKEKLLNAETAPREARAEPGNFAPPLHQLRRTLHDRWIGGVCGGLGRMTGVPSWAWRILFVLTVFLNGLGLLMYILLWIFVPQESPAVARASAQTEGPAI